MALVNRRAQKNLQDDEQGAIEFINLAEYKVARESETHGMRSLKVVELERPENISRGSNFIYTGNIVIFDTSNAPTDQMNMVNIERAIKTLADATGGQHAKPGSSYYIVTPRDIYLDKKKVRDDF
ncbi:MAG: cell division protein SepF [Candidatus Thermoplasmatota archaeon]|nr:cell division protein SepF [Candidatus Thermoplasmatota archaeon]